MLQNIHSVNKNNMKDFELKKEKWLKEVAEQCHEFALKTDLDFYCFQTSISFNPDILLIGINPGNNGKYSDYLKNNKIEKRKPESLYYSQNLLIEEANWGDSLSQVRRKLKEIFFTEQLFCKLTNSVMTNTTFFNTISSQNLKDLDHEIKNFCLQKTIELIDILNPKNIIIFTSDTSVLRKIGVKNIQKIGKYTKSGILNNKLVHSIPHFSARGYNSTEIRNLIGNDLIDVLR